LAPSVNIAQKQGPKPAVKATKNIKKVARKKVSKKAQSESDFEQSVRRKGDKLKKKKLVLENNRKLRDRKNRVKSS
jgi:hypothetical protein